MRVLVGVLAVGIVSGLNSFVAVAHVHEGNAHEHQQQQCREHDAANHKRRRDQRREFFMVFLCGDQYDAGKLAQHYFSPWVGGRDGVFTNPEPLLA